MFLQKTEDLNLSVFNMITEINESETLTKHISYKCKCRFDWRKCGSDQWWNNDKCWCECEKRHVCQKHYVWNPATWNCENRKYLVSNVDGSAVTRDKIIESYDKETNILNKF